MGRKNRCGAGTSKSKIHFAAYALVGESMTNPGKYFLNNVGNGTKLLDAAVKVGVKKFVFSSTCATYGTPEKMPMDESLAQVALDLSGRAWLVFDAKFPRDRVGEMPTEMVPHFFKSVSDSLTATLHLSVTGDNTHHMVEALFKGFGRALRSAIARGAGSEIPSSKGVL